MIRLISERTLEMNEELCACFINWQKVFDRVEWSKLMHTLKETGIDWREIRLVSKLYMDQNVKLWLEHGKTRSMKIRGVNQDSV